MRFLFRYFARLDAGRLILWCYFFWWLVVAVRYFDPDRRIWLTSVGLAVIIAGALYVNAATSVPGRRIRLGFWPTARFFLTPFCVSSFAALVKGRGFVLIFSPDWRDTAIALGLCAGFVLIALAFRRLPAIVLEGWRP